MQNCYYLPVPPRTWSRVQGAHTYATEPPTANQLWVEAQKNKGNVLQYRDISSTLTAKERYSRLVRPGIGNRVWATQNMRGYTNPNSRMLARTGATNKTIPDMQPTTEPITCPEQSVQPSQEGAVIRDGGTLVCGTYENACTGITTAAPRSSIVCSPNTASNVPGRPQLLCWDYRWNTWNPRQRTTMAAGGSKFPVGYKGLASAVHYRS